MDRLRGVLLVIPLVWAQVGKKNRKQTIVDSVAWRNAASSFARGVALFSQGLIEESVEYFSKAAEAAPQSAGVHYYLARIAYQQGDYIRMLTHAEKAYKESPNELWIALGYAAALQLNNQESEAVILLEKLAEQYPYEPEVLFRLAQAYKNKGDELKADKTLEQIQHITANYDELFQARVQLWIEAGKLERAAALAESLALLWPSHEMYLETAARIYELMRNYPKLIETVGRLLQMDLACEGCWSLVLNYIEVFEETWDSDEWQRYLLSPHVPVEVKYNLLSRIGWSEEEEFAEIMEKLLREYPSALGWTLWGDYWSRQGRWDSAALAYKKGLLLDSLNLNLSITYFYALWRLGGGDSLLAEVHRLQETFPGQGKLFLWEGVAHASRRHWREALAAFQKGWKLTPQPDTLTARAATYMHLFTESAEMYPTPLSQKRLSLYFSPALAELLWHIALLRSKNPSPVSLSTNEASIYQMWYQILFAIHRKKESEAVELTRRISPDIVLPLEMWEDILFKLGRSSLGSLYTELKARARKQYPLSGLWRALP
ncbi:MAG: tetratricopeptide repeat protein [Bacteroidia bacterium]|nr:tetratricopeptide repeat protein [Bacteroidia bacterium]MDW8235793.1 tetratricopeptide repeat protein [Bacteroidia bacterium]